MLDLGAMAYAMILNMSKKLQPITKTPLEVRLGFQLI
jgi:hypothetical protein